MALRMMAGVAGALLVTSPVLGQDLPGSAAKVATSGVVFERALNGGDGAATVGQDDLSLRSGPKTDFFRETDGTTAYGNAPVLLSRVDNTRPFTFTVRVAPVLTETYDAGALYLWVREDKWLKFAFERDERGLSRIVTVRTDGTSDDNNHDAVAAPAVHLRISSDTRSIGFYYSRDAKSWQLVRVFRNDYPAALWLGLSAQSPLGGGNIARFSEMRMTPGSIKDFRAGE